MRLSDINLFNKYSMKIYEDYEIDIPKMLYLCDSYPPLCTGPRCKSMTFDMINYHKVKPCFYTNNPSNPIIYLSCCKTCSSSWGKEYLRK